MAAHSGRQWRVRWQRLGMSRPQQRLYATEDGARRWALVVQGRLAEVYPDRVPDEPFCCPGTMSYECGCGGETWAQRWARESAAVPPLVWGPTLDSRPVGEFSGVEVLHEPEPLHPSVVTAFETGGGIWPIRARLIELDLTAGNPDPDDVPF